MLNARRLKVILPVLALWLVLGTAVPGSTTGCGGGKKTPVEDGDWECPEGTVWNPYKGECVSADTERDRDREEGVMEEPDGDGTDDADRPDDDAADQPDGDPTDQPDGDDGETDTPADGDSENADSEFDSPEEWEKIEGDQCVCFEDLDCPGGYRCLDQCHCTLAPDEDEFDGELFELDGFEAEELCAGGFPACSAHADCPSPPLLCDLETGCCAYGVMLECQFSDQCPDGYYCAGTGFCNYDCITAEDCPPDYCCTSRGQCNPNIFCYQGDSDEEEEETGCQSCDDCQTTFGENYYCNMDTSACTEKPDSPDACCEDSDCASGLCNLRTGLCFAGGDNDPTGRITGTVFLNSEFAGCASDPACLSFRVLAYTEQQVLLRSTAWINPEIEKGVASGDYTLTDLPEGPYDVRIQIWGLGDVSLPHPTSPIGVVAPSQLHRDGIDFYIGLDDPFLGTIQGVARVASAHETAILTVRLYRIGEDGSLTLEGSELAGEMDLNQRRAFEFSNLTTGSYLLDGVSVVGNLKDYWSRTLTIDLHDHPSQVIDGITLFFGTSDPAWGEINGSIFHAPWLNPGNFRILLYDRYPEPGVTPPVAEAGFSARADAYFSFPNVEFGTGGFPANYWIRVLVETDLGSLWVVPPEDQVSIEQGEFNDFTIQPIYLEKEEPGACSVSGTLFFNDAYDHHRFYIHVSPDARPSVGWDDPVLGGAVDEGEGYFFLERLDPGDYQLLPKAVDWTTGAVITPDSPYLLTIPSDPGSCQILDQIMDLPFMEDRNGR